ncbi:sodium:calcium antiporter [Longirhabdus pacifica]|uniref:sodium:calcium antiporter n=1 Tax=Longirhabdus pacifica TaxID=2305227 RepID=UPI001008B006|nr:sodium:calcium antiporter [Longirhabdus pacifica]
MLYFIFLIAAICTVFLAIQLSKYVNVIGEKSTLHAGILGLLLGGATSLPEITTSVTSVVIDSPDIAVGNVLGSNLFNILILAVVDMVYRQKRIFNYSTRQDLHSNVMVIVLSSFISVFLYFQFPYQVLGVGIDTIALIAVYVIGIKLISRSELPIEEVKGFSSSDNEHTSPLTLKQAVSRFIIAAVFILVFGTILTVSADKIASLTGIDASFIGSFLVAASTSLPEAAAVVAAVRLANHNLAISSILGSNTFNITILMLTDVLYRKGNLLTGASFIHLYTVIGTIVLSFIMMYALRRKRDVNTFTYVLPSALIVLSYFIISYLVYLQS